MNDIKEARPGRFTRAAFAFIVGISLVFAQGSIAASAATSSGPSSVQPQDEEYRGSNSSDAVASNFQTATSVPATLRSQLVTLGGVVTFRGRVQAHNAHKSGFEVSGHVTWSLDVGTNRKVRLTSTLKARTSWFTFRTMGEPSSANVYAGGGRGRAAVARYECRNSNKRDWYTFGQMYVSGISDPVGFNDSAITSVACDGGLS